jgi:hypothetical protein
MDSTSTPCSAGSIEREEAARPSEREEEVSEREEAVSEREEGPSSSRIKLGPVPLTTPLGVASTPPVTSKFSLCRCDTSPLALLLRPLRKAPAAATPATPPTKPYRKGGSEKKEWLAIKWYNVFDPPASFNLLVCDTPRLQLSQQRRHRPTHTRPKKRFVGRSGHRNLEHFLGSNLPRQYTLRSFRHPTRSNLDNCSLEVDVGDGHSHLCLAGWDRFSHVAVVDDRYLDEL